MFNQERPVRNLARRRLEGTSHNVNIRVRRGRVESLDQLRPCLQIVFTRGAVDNAVGFGSRSGAHEQARAQMLPEPLTS